MQQSLAPIISNIEVMPGGRLIWLEAPELATAAKPGQFVMVRCGDDTLLRRPFSVHQTDNGKLALLYNVIGKGTSWLSQCQSGDDIDLFGPLGNGFSVRPDAHNLLLVAGGIGVAPLCFLADEAVRQGYSVKMLIGAATATQLCRENLIPPESECFNATEDGTNGNRGMVTVLLPEHADWANQIFACGPPPMYKTMAQMPELKNRPVQVSLEIMMGCGLGICYGCTVKTRNGLKQVCKDGPIFNLNDILWDEQAII